jgi:ribose transport system ATP-binding protein/rhamnose transport system ATP-binding protein
MTPSWRTQAPRTAVALGPASSAGDQSIAAAALRSVTKAFGDTIVVDRVSVELFSGEVLALVGENGAGKSTCVKLLSGVHRPDGGHVEIAGERVDLHSALNAQDRGIAVVQQHPGLFGELSVAENVFAGRLPRGRFARIDHKRMESETARLLDLLGLHVSPRTPVKLLRTAEQQLVEIARGLAVDAQVLILDEPTAALSSHEVDRLFEVVERLRSSGMALMFVSHRLEEVFLLSNRVAVLRDGKLVATADTASLTQPELVHLMVGRPITDMYAEPSSAPGAPVLELEGLSYTGQFEDVSLSVRSGEILGLAGLVGSGRTEIARTIFGIQRPTSGRIVLDGKPLTIHSSSDALKNGIAYVSEDRRGQSLVMDFSVLTNATLPSLRKIAHAGLLRRKDEIAMVRPLLGELSLRFRGYDQPVGMLSGGNQQKVVLAKWLATKPRVLILDEPTQGVDVQTKAEVHRLVTELARRDVAVLLISSELPELLNTCDRIAVMREGHLVEQFTRAEASQETIGAAATGTVLADGYYDRANGEAAAVAPRDAEPEIAELPANGRNASAPAVHGESTTKHKNADPAAAVPATHQTELPIEPTSDDVSVGGRWHFPTGRIASVYQRREFGLVCAVILFGIVVTAVDPRFPTWSNQSEVLTSAALFSFLVLGETFVLLTGNIDLTVGSVYGLTGYLAASMMRSDPHLPVIIALLAGCGAGMACGLVTGSIVAYGKVPAIVATLGMLSVIQGLITLVFGVREITIDQVPQSWLSLASHQTFGILNLEYFAIAVLAIGAILLRFSRTGREFFAVGSNPGGARQIGIPVDRRVLTAFVLSGLLAGLGGVMAASRLVVVDAQFGQAGNQLLTTIACAVVGGIAVFGGVGTVVGVVLGTLTLQIINNGLDLMRVDPLWDVAFFGAVMILIVTVDQFTTRRLVRRTKS